MPVFKEIELRDIGKDMQTRPEFVKSLTPFYTDEYIRSRFHMYNGIIRHVLPRTLENVADSEQQSKSAFDSLEQFQLQKITAGTIENGKLSAFVVYYNVDRDSFLSYVLTPVSEKTNETLKKLLRELICKILLLNSKGMWERVRINLASLRWPFSNWLLNT